MNIFNKVTLQGMKKNRTRTIVTVIGVILSAAMFTAVATFGTSLLNFLINGSIVKYGDWHVEFMDVDSSFIQEQNQDERVINTAAFQNLGYATLEGGKSAEKPYLFIAGFNQKTFDTLPIDLVSGRLPENSEEILVPVHVASKGGVRFKVGDTISLAVGNRLVGNKNLNQHDPFILSDESGVAEEVLMPVEKKTYTVVGICERPGFEEHSAPGYTLITKSDTKNINSFSLFVKLKNPRKVKDYVSNTVGANEYVLNDYILRFMGISENKIFNALLYVVGGILVTIIMIGSIFLIYNSFNISLTERTRQFGILSSIGATARQLRNSVLFEGLCIGSIGIPIGIMVGICSVGLIIPIVAGNMGNIFYSTVSLTLSVSVPTIILAVVISMVTILISAYIPAKKAANTPVMESIRQTNDVKIESKAVKTSKFAQRIYGLEGTLALKNFKRNKKRYRSIVLSLVLSVVLFVSGNAFGTTLERLSKQQVTDFDYDIVFSTQDMEDSEVLPFYNKLKSVDGVYESSYQKVFKYSCKAKTSDLSARYREYSGYTAANTVDLPMDIQFIEDSIYLNFIKSLGLSAEEYTGQNAKMIAVAKSKGVENTKDGKRELLDMFKSRSMNLTIAPQINNKPKMKQGQSIDITFVDTYPIDPPPSQSSEVKPYVFMVVAPYSIKEKFENPDAHANIGLTFLSKNPSNSVSEMEKIIQGVGITSPYNLLNLHSMLEYYRSMIFVIDIFTYVFVVMISLIAVANVFNTISTNIMLRRRELAMLRSVGMSDRDFNKMMNLECIFYGMRTLLIGLPIAGIISWLIYKGLADVERMYNFNYVFPWSSMAISVFSVIFIVFITMKYAVSKIKKENIIDALRDDMT